MEGDSPAFLDDTVFLLPAWIVPVEPSLDLYSGARAQRLLQSLQELGLEIRKQAVTLGLVPAERRVLP